MVGDKLIIEKHHTERAADICELVAERIEEKSVISVAGESGCGKSELASELARLLTQRGIRTAILQQDDYFVFPPKTNHEMRRQSLDLVGVSEVKLDFLDCNLRSFKKGETTIYKPLVIYDEDRITTEEMDVGEVDTLIVEGTYTSLLHFVNLRIFIVHDYKQTWEARKRRARDNLEPFIEKVLEREHRVISQHRGLADVIITDWGQALTFDK